jgi:two-component system, LytTR family, sensor kinase
MVPRNAKYYWLCQLAGWGFVALSMIFFAFTYERTMNENFFIRVFIIVASGIFFTHLLRGVIKRSGWLLLPVEKVIGRMFFAVVLTSVLHSSFYIWLANFLGVVENPKPIDMTSKIMVATINNGLFIVPWVLIYYFFHYIEKSRKQEIDTLKLEALVKELELKTIKSHINPHFIFNALNSIRALIDENPSRARDAVTELSNLLRSSMQSDKVETVTLERELSIVKDYLALEHIRFEDRLRVEYDIDEDTLGQPVPPMMLQTLVENAIKHGIGRQVKGGVVRVISDFKGDHHEMVVQNTGRLDALRNTEGFGISSTQNRLQLLFGTNASFSIQELNGNTVEAKVLIPVADLISHN